MKIFTFLKNPVYGFLFKALGLYVVWYFVYEMWLHPMEGIDLLTIRSTLNLALIILKTIGFHTFSGNDRLIGIDGSNGLWMGDNCDCVELCALFAGFIIAFPGKWMKKLWFIPIGMVLIYILNVLRVIGLAIIQRYFLGKWMEFNHTYTFTIIVYAFIFLLWFYWIKRLSPGKNMGQ